LEECEKQRKKCGQQAFALQPKEDLAVLQKKAADQAESSSRKLADRITS
jgi:hypothetical protein